MNKTALTAAIIPALLGCLATGCGPVASEPDAQAQAELDRAAAPQGKGSAEAYAIVAERLPALKAFTLVRLNSQALVSKVEGGEPVTLPFAPSEAPNTVVPMKISLSHHNMREEGAVGVTLTQGKGGQQAKATPLGPTTTFVGLVLAPVPTVAAAVAKGNLFMANIMAPEKVNGASGHSFVEPLTRVLRANGATSSEIQAVTSQFTHVVYNTGSMVIDLPCDENGPSADGDEPLKGASRATTAMVSEDISIWMMSDVDHYWEKGSSTTAVWDEQSWILFGVELYWFLAEPGPYGSGEFELGLDISGQSVWISGGPSSTDPATLLEQTHHWSSWDSWVASPNAVGLTHGFTGKNLDGNVIGKAWKIGGFDDACGATYSGSSACKHSISQPNDFGSSTWYTQTILLAHELGHNLDGHHSDHDPSFSAGSMSGATIMKSGLSSSQVPFYSQTNAEAIADKVAAECASDPC